MGTTKRTATTVILALSMCGALFLGGCAETTPTGTDADAGQDAEYPVTVTDDAGRQVVIESEPLRIVSLAPANTEIVYALGLIDRLVGVTSYDDYPEQVAGLPVMGDFVGPNVEAITAAQADLVLATTGVQADLIAQLEDAGATVLAIDPQTMDGLYYAIEMIGEVTGAVAEAAEVVSDMRDEIDRISSLVSEYEARTCFVEIAQEPLFTIGEGTLIDELVRLANGSNVVSEPGYVGYSVEQLLADDPEVYMATLGSMSDPDALGDRPGFDSLQAVEDERVFTLTDNLVSRPGPRITQGLNEIAMALHPEAFEE